MIESPNGSDTQTVPIDTASRRVVSVTVTFNPDMPILQRQQQNLPPGSIRILVDNASSAQTRSQLRSWVSGQASAVLIENPENIGLAAALNQGVRAARQHAPVATHVLLLDQDSEPASGSAAALLKAFDQLEESGQRVGAVGPALVDPATGLHHGFHQIDGWRWRRSFETGENALPIRCANLNGSGSLVPLELYLALGGVEDSFFIDHVDTEWAFRLMDQGYSLWGIPSTEFVHRMGDQGRRIWFMGWRVWPSRSPKRHFFLFRNAVRLMRRPYVPSVWKGWAVVKLALTAVVFGVWGPHRIEQLRQMARGTASGLHSNE